MSEEKEGPQSSPEAIGAGADPAAVALALGGASRDKADVYLDKQSVLADKQSSLIDAQKHHLHEQFKHLHLSVWEKQLGVFLRVATAIVGVAVAAGFALMVWDASHSKGLLIEPFSVPPDMAGRGLNGQVVAAQLLDRLAVLSASESSRSTQSYANNWGNDIKVEIPETGISISEMERFLRGWLGHDTRISGEVYRTATGIAVTARAGAKGATFTGAETDIDTLVEKAAEHVFETTQPYRYANYLDRNYNPVGAQERVARATAIYRKLIAGDDLQERAWAWNGLGTIEVRFHANSRLAAEYYRRAVAAVPDFTIGYYALSSRDGALGLDEEGFQSVRQASRLLHGDHISDLNPRYAIYARLSSDGALATNLGDYAAAIPILKSGAELPDEFSVLARSTYISGAVASMARRHDLRAARAYLREVGWTLSRNYNARSAVDIESEDWNDILAAEAVARKGQPGGNGTPAGLGTFNNYRDVFALAHAKLGDFAAAETVVAPIAPDSGYGLRVRARIAELEGQHARADLWFARAEKHAPSIPFTDALWGQALLARGKPDAAIEKFKLANQKGPHFADPLEGWGEALMAKNQSHLALAKFAESEKYAPNWGRLHLKWGEALSYAGKPDEAKKQFARAAALDLTPSEKSELAKEKT